MAADSVLPSVLQFYDNVYKLTEYEDKQDADVVWTKMRADLPGQLFYSVFSYNKPNRLLPSITSFLFFLPFTKIFYGF